MRLTISDDLADTYLALLPVNGNNHHLPPGVPAHQLEPAIVRVLERAAPLMHPGAVVLTHEQAALLAERLQLPAGATDPARLLDAALALCDMKIGKFRFSLPAPVLKGLKDRAERENKPLGEYLQQAINRVTEDVGIYA